MKKNVISIVLFITLLCFSSCATQSTYNSFAYYSDTSMGYSLTLNSVLVTIDHVREEGIENQIRKTVENHLKAEELSAPVGSEQIILDIVITQRSYMSDARLYNSIYVSAVAHNKDGAVCQFENENISGPITILSSPDQDKIIKRIINRLLAKNRAQKKLYEANQPKEK